MNVKRIKESGRYMLFNFKSNKQFPVYVNAELKLIGMLGEWFSFDCIKKEFWFLRREK